MAQIILTTEERKELTTIPYNISEEILLTYCAFDEEDIKNIVGNHKDLYNRIGYAVQLFHMRYFGWSYSIQTRVPTKVLDFIVKQLDEQAPITWNFKTNYKRPNTIAAHFAKICQDYGYRQLTDEDEKRAYRIISANADVVENRVFIVKEIISSLRKELIILPKISTIEKWVQEV